MMRMLSPFLILALGLAASGARAEFETRAVAAWIYDDTTDTVLLSKNAETPRPPASMSKLMTLDLLFEAVRDGRVGLDTRFSVSERAAGMGGSSMFLNPKDRPTVEELIQGIVVQSGNDACVVVAEGLAGTEEAFAKLMNERARAIGLRNSTFANASGWPDPNQQMSMEDLGLLARRLIDEFPEFYHYFGQPTFAFDGRVPSNHRNRNPLLALGIGADGLKTGHTAEAGYGLVGSAVQGDRRIIFVISGLPDDAARAEEAESVVNWAFRQFVQKTLVEKGTKLAEVPVWMGSERSVAMIAPEDIKLLVPATVRGGIAAEITYETPLRAPIAEGQQIGTLTVELPDLQRQELPLTAATAVAKGGFVPRVRTAAIELLSQVTGQAAGL